MTSLDMTSVVVGRHEAMSLIWSQKTHVNGKFPQIAEEKGWTGVGTPSQKRDPNIFRRMIMGSFSVLGGEVSRSPCLTLSLPSWSAV